MNLPLWTVALVHLLLVAISTSANQAPNTIPDEQIAIWKTLCDKKSSLVLRHSSQIKALAETLNANLGPSDAIFECFNRTRPALDDLNQLIEENKLNVCSLEAIARIRIYFAIYVSSHQNRVNEQQLPKALKNFFLSYGFQVSKTCKKNMIPTLEASYAQMSSKSTELGGKFGEKLREYYGIMSDLLTESGPIGLLIKNPVDYDDLLLPRDIHQLILDEYGKEEDFENENEEMDDYNRIFMQTKSSETIRVFKTICEKRYKSIYMQIMPLLYLSNIGFNYQSEELERELEELRSNNLVRQTYRIAFLCESLKNIVLVDDPEHSEGNRALQTTAVMRILSPAEAGELMKQSAGQNNADDDRHKETQELIGAIKEFVYDEPNYEVRLEDKILDDEDKDLRKMLRSFSANKSELDRIRSRFIRKLKETLISSLKQGKFSAVLSNFVDMNARDYQSDEASLDNKQIVEAIDKRVDEVYNQEEAVSWGRAAKGWAARAYYKQANARRGGGLWKVFRRAKKKIVVKKPFWFLLATGLFIIGVLCVHATIG